ATGDDADARDLEHLADLCVAEHHFALFGTKHTFECELDVLDSLVDDLVQLDLDAFTLGGITCIVVRRTWKPTMIAPDARASRMSLSVIAPTPRWMTSTVTSAVDSWPNASASASAGPP